MEKPEKSTYYPRKMRVGWCIAHTITVMGINVECFGAKVRSYQEAFKIAERMNKQPTGDGHNDTTT